MPYTVQWPKRGAYKKFSGNVTMSELLNSLSDVQCNPNYDTFEFSITDFLEVDNIALNEADVTTYVARAIGGEFTNDKLAVGIVVTDPKMISLLKTRYQPLVAYQVGYFSTLEACSEWVLEKTGTKVEF